MGTALVALIDRAARQIELDPAVRIGTRLDALGEAVLLHTTSAGHCGETAQYLARALRRSGWLVTVRAFDHLAPVRSAFGPGMLTEGMIESLCERIGPAPGEAMPDADALIAGAIPRVRRQRADTTTGRPRWQCRLCGHVTMGRGVRSHVENIRHDDWLRVLVMPDGTITPMEDEECPPASQEAPLSASG